LSASSPDKLIVSRFRIVEHDEEFRLLVDLGFRGPTGLHFLVARWRSFWRVLNIGKRFGVENPVLRDVKFSVAHRGDTSTVQIHPACRPTAANRTNEAEFSPTRSTPCTDQPMIAAQFPERPFQRAQNDSPATAWHYMYSLIQSTAKDMINDDV